MQKTRLDGPFHRTTTIRCLRCGENWPDSGEFFYYLNGRRHGRTCLACKADQRAVRLARRVCPTCHRVRTQSRQCHGCASRVAGPLTTVLLASWGLSA